MKLIAAFIVHCTSKLIKIR